MVGSVLQAAVSLGVSGARSAESAIQDMLAGAGMGGAQNLVLISGGRSSGVAISSAVVSAGIHVGLFRSAFGGLLGGAVFGSTSRRDEQQRHRL